MPLERNGVYQDRDSPNPSEIRQEIADKWRQQQEESVHQNSLNGAANIDGRIRFNRQPVPR
jgi:hypothetical protein